jgi:hypothetical protein
MNEASRIACRTLPATSPEQVRDARARAWAYVFKVCNSKKTAECATSPNGRDDKQLARKEGRLA